MRQQTVCEISIEAALRSLIGAKRADDDPDTLIRRPSTLMDKDSQRLMEHLCGQRPTQESWWQGYSSHVKRRHAIVHSGLVVSWQDSVESIEASHGLREWLIEVQRKELDLPEVDDG